MAESNKSALHNYIQANTLPLTVDRNFVSLSMVELSTDAAFTLLVNNQYRWHKMGGNESTRLSILTRIKQGKEISMDTKFKYLKMAGFRLKSYPRWVTPKFN